MTTKIFATAIVKNEMENISRMLDSVDDQVDGLLMVDTGSSDGTDLFLEKVIIDRTDGSALETTTFIDFAQARNTYIDLGSINKKADWLLVVDADRELVVHDENWKEAFDKLVSETNATVVKIPIICGNTRFHNTMFIKVSGEECPTVRYILPTHECLEVINPENHVEAAFDGISLIEHGTGSSRVEKYERDERLLKEFITNAINDTEWTPPRKWALARAYYYLGQTLQESGDEYGAFASYASCITTSSWGAERSWAAFKIAYLSVIPFDIRKEFIVNAFNENPTFEIIYARLWVYMQEDKKEAARTLFENMGKLEASSDDGFQDQFIRTIGFEEYAEFFNRE